MLWQGPNFDTKIVSQMAQNAKMEASANKAIKSRDAIVGFFCFFLERLVSCYVREKRKMKINFDEV